MAIISILLPCRIDTNRIGQFKRYMESLSNSCDDLKNIELLIKFDDDQNISEAIEVIEKYKSIIEIKYIVTPRGKGYQDIPVFYMDLLFIADANYKIAIGHSIDLVFINKGFDTLFINEIKRYEDEIFVIHSCITPSFINKINTINDAAQWVDGFPAWSRKWIEIQGKFGHNALTDGWTQLTEFLLFNEYGIDRRVDLSNHKLFQEIDNVDRSVESEYWQIKRRAAMESQLSQRNVEMARQNAKNIMLNIVNFECLRLGKENKHSVEVYQKYLIKSVLNAYDEALIVNQKFEANNIRLLKLEENNRELSNISDKKLSMKLENYERELIEKKSERQDDEILREVADKDQEIIRLNRYVEELYEECVLTKRSLMEKNKRKLKKYRRIFRLSAIIIFIVITILFFLK